MALPAQPKGPVCYIKLTFSPLKIVRTKIWPRLRRNVRRSRPRKNGKREKLKPSKTGRRRRLKPNEDGRHQARTKRSSGLCSFRDQQEANPVGLAFLCFTPIVESHPPATVHDFMSIWRFVDNLHSRESASHHVDSDHPSSLVGHQRLQWTPVGIACILSLKSGERRSV